MHGARAVILARIDMSPWLDALLRRRPYNVAVAALANKLARTIWAVLAKGTALRSGGVQRRSNMNLAHSEGLKPISQGAQAIHA